MSQFHTLTIDTITKETEQAVSISFKVPELLKQTFKFKAGQYITLKTTINGKEVRRDYSLCSSASSGLLKVAVKAVKNGTFSKFANTLLTEGDSIEVAPPKGRFIFEPDTAAPKTVVAFAAGSGITPIMSILKTTLETSPKHKFILVYGNKTLKDTIFLNELLQLQHQYSSQLHIQFLYSQSQEDNALFGRIEKSTVNLIVKNKYKDSQLDAFYLCGPEGMITTVKEVLLEQGVNENTIHYELFKAAKAEAAATTEQAAVNQGNCAITITVDDETTSFTMPTKQTILEAALDNDLDAPYSCQGGICSSCIARVTIGKAEMRQNNILTENEVAEGLILTCQAQPVTKHLTVDYDDV